MASSFPWVPVVVQMPSPMEGQFCVVLELLLVPGLNLVHLEWLTISLAKSPLY